MPLLWLGLLFCDQDILGLYLSWGTCQLMGLYWLYLLPPYVPRFQNRSEHFLSLALTLVFLFPVWPYLDVKSSLLFVHGVQLCPKVLNCQLLHWYYLMHIMSVRCCLPHKVQPSCSNRNKIDGRCILQESYVVTEYLKYWHVTYSSVITVEFS
jgi:hypothetical protein